MHVVPCATDVERPFAACFGRGYSRFHRYAWGELRDATAAKDATQSTFAAVWQRYFMGAENRHVDVDRLAFRMLKLRLDGGRARSPATDASHTPPRGFAWAARAVRRITGGQGNETQALAQVVDVALDAMRPRCREVFLLRRECGLSYKDIAALCGTDVDSVSALMHRAQFALRDHVDRAGFGAVARRTAADTGRWKIAEFSREPDLYESQEAIIERDGNPDSALISDYIAGELSPAQEHAVAVRLERDPEFRVIAEPLLMAWSVPPTSRPLSEQDILRAWHEVRRRAQLPDLEAGAPH